MSPFSLLRALVLAVGCSSIAAANEAPCEPCVNDVCDAKYRQASWVFSPSTYTHDPCTGARVAQYMRTPPVQPLEDPRMVTSRYYKSRTNLRGADGSFDTYYQTQQWGNGRGGIDAEWERFHDAWKESYLQNGYYNQSPGFNNGFPGQWGQGGWGWGGGFNNGVWSGSPGGWGGGPGWGGGGPGWGGGPQGGGGPGWGGGPPWRGVNGNGANGGGQGPGGGWGGDGAQGEDD